MLNARRRRRLNPDLRLARRRSAGTAGDLLTWDMRARGDLAVVAVSGELDIESALGLERDLAPVADTGRLLILDLAGLRFCDCAGLSLFLRVQQRARAAGGSLHLAALTPRVLRVITAARLADAFPITASVADTVAALDEAAIAAPPLPRPGDGDGDPDPPLRRPGAVFAGVSAGIALTQRARQRRAMAAPAPAGSPACSSRPRALLPATVRNARR